MARIETDPNYSTPTFSRATAATDIFKKEDVQNLAAAFSGHVHDGSGKGLAAALISASAIPDGSVTSAKIADGTIATGDLADGSVATVKLAADAASALVAFAQLASNQTTSASMVAIPSATVTLTCTGGDLIVWWVIQNDAAAPGDNTTGIFKMR